VFSGYSDLTTHMPYIIHTFDRVLRRVSWIADGEGLSELSFHFTELYKERKFWDNINMPKMSSSSSPSIAWLFAIISHDEVQHNLFHFCSPIAIFSDSAALGISWTDDDKSFEEDESM